MTFEKFQDPFTHETASQFVEVLKDDVLREQYFFWLVRNDPAMHRAFTVADQVLPEVKGTERQLAIMLMVTQNRRQQTESQVNEMLRFKDLPGSGWSD